MEKGSPHCSLRTRPKLMGDTMTQPFDEIAAILALRRTLYPHETPPQYAPLVVENPLVEPPNLKVVAAQEPELPIIKPEAPERHHQIPGLR